MLNALTNVCFWGKEDIDQPLLTNLDLSLHGLRLGLFYFVARDRMIGLRPCSIFKQFNSLFAAIGGEGGEFEPRRYGYPLYSGFSSSMILMLTRGRPCGL